MTKKITEKSSSYHKVDLKNKLISSGLEILSEEGIGSLSLRNVAKRAGVSHAAPYRHFKNRESLIAAIAEEGYKKLSDSITTSASLFPQNPELQLKEAGWGYIQFAVENPEHLKVMFGSFSKECVLDKGTSFDALIDLIITGQKADMIREGDPLTLALTTWSTVHGLALIIINNQMPGNQIPGDGGAEIYGDGGAVSEKKQLDKKSLEHMSRKVIDTIFEGLKNPGMST
ncbi:MAG: TetR/AcrR family transcriptional regulator [Spirochaetales bacterium]|nr:TetR/AcrR family transcriptional regulator [Spirochaetales bacterium]